MIDRGEIRRVPRALRRAAAALLLATAGSANALTIEIGGSARAGASTTHAFTIEGGATERLHDDGRCADLVCGNPALSPRSIATGATPIPEPGSLSLLGAGLLLLGLLGWQRSRRTSELQMPERRRSERRTSERRTSERFNAERRIAERRVSAH